MKEKFVNIFLLMSEIYPKENERLGETKTCNMKINIFWIYGELQWSSDVVIRMQKVYKVAGRGQILF